MYTRLFNNLGTFDIITQFCEFDYNTNINNKLYLHDLPLLIPWYMFSSLLRVYIYIYVCTFIHPGQDNHLLLVRFIRLCNCIQVIPVLFSYSILLPVELHHSQPIARYTYLPEVKAVRNANHVRGCSGTRLLGMSHCCHSATGTSF